MASQMMSQMTDVDGTQASCPVRAAVAARDVKPEIRFVVIQSQACCKELVYCQVCHDPITSLS